MLSVIIPSADGADPLQRLLAALVPAAVDGLVRDVLLVGAADAACDQLCEDSGVVRAGDMTAAARSARSDRILVLPASVRLAHDWQDAMKRHLGRAPVGGVLPGQADGLAERLRGAAYGVLTTRERILEAGEGATIASLRRDLGRMAARIR